MELRNTLSWQGGFGRRESRRKGISGIRRRSEEQGEAVQTACLGDLFEVWMVLAVRQLTGHSWATGTPEKYVRAGGFWRWWGPDGKGGGGRVVGGQFRASV